MERLNLTHDGGELRIEGFPDAAKLIRLAGPKARRLADLALHVADLEFAGECLSAMNDASGDSGVLREALWRSAVVHFVKCFSSSEARFSLDAAKVYQSDPGAIRAFDYFKSLRSKHFIHDENSYAQSLPCAVLNKQEADQKIAKVVCLSLVGKTLSPVNYGNLQRLINVAHEWVVAQCDELFTAITAELEEQPYEALSRMAGVSYEWPDAGAVHARRPRP